jgi:sulfite reductase alpha subunit-like flavoprotein
LLALGAQNVVPLGLGDDKAEEKYETEYYEWLPNVVSEMQLPPKPETVPEPKFALNITQGTTPKKYPTFLPSGTQLVPLKVNKLISPKTHNRDVRHYEFDIKGQKPMMYASGDCMAIYPHNNEE